MIADSPKSIELFGWLALRSAVKLEAKGMTHSSGKSRTAVAREKLRLKPRTKREDVLVALNSKIEELRNAANS